MWAPNGKGAGDLRAQGRVKAPWWVWPVRSLPTCPPQEASMAGRVGLIGLGEVLAITPGCQQTLKDPWTPLPVQWKQPLSLPGHGSSFVPKPPTMPLMTCPLSLSPSWSPTFGHEPDIPPERQWGTRKWQMRAGGGANTEVGSPFRGHVSPRPRLGADT